MGRATPKKIRVTFVDVDVDVGVDVDVDVEAWGGQPPKNQSNICLLKMQCLQQATIAKFLWVTIGEGSSKKSE